LVALVKSITQTAHLSKSFDEYVGSMQPIHAMKVHGISGFEYSQFKTPSKIL